VVPMRPEEGYVSLVNPPSLSVFLIFPLLVLPFTSLCWGYEAFGPPDPRSQKKQLLRRFIGWRARRRRRRMRRRSGPTRRCWPAIHWKSVVEHRRGSLSQHQGVGRQRGDGGPYGLQPRGWAQSALASAGPYGGMVPSTQGPAASLSRTRASTEPALAPTLAKKARAVKEEVAPPP
jgi:hypothetical protein